jgi:hypothetical protein
LVLFFGLGIGLGLIRVKLRAITKFSIMVTIWRRAMERIRVKIKV